MVNWFIALTLALAVLSGCSGGGEAGSTDDAQPPPQIELFQASAASIVPGAGVVLEWSVAGATSVDIEPVLDQAHGTLLAVSPSETTTYVLRARNGGSITSQSITIDVQAPQAAPAATSVSAIGLAGGGVLLYWTAVSSASAYDIERQANFEPLAHQVATVAGTRYVWIDTSTTANTLYTYRVKPRNAITSQEGSTVSIVAAPPPPEGPVGPVINAPDGTTVGPGGTLRFAASEPVVWLLPEGLGAGRIGVDGVYSAPASPTTAILVARGRIAASLAIIVR